MKILAILALIISLPLQATPIKLSFSNNWHYIIDDNTNTYSEVFGGAAGYPEETWIYEMAPVIGWAGVNIDPTRFRHGVVMWLTFKDSPLFELNIVANFEPLPGQTTSRSQAFISSLGRLDPSKNLVENLQLSLNQTDFYEVNDRFINKPRVTLLSISAVPVPSAFLLMATGIIGLVSRNHLKKRFLYGSYILLVLSNK